MMVDDSERREVARRLRELDDSELQVYDMTYFAIQRAVGGDSEPYLDGRELADRLADLIEPEPERTCHDTDYSRESTTCSECGEITMNTLYFVDLDGGYRTVKSHRPRFCSNCGVRVIGEEAGDAD